MVSIPAVSTPEESILENTPVTIPADEIMAESLVALHTPREPGSVNVMWAPTHTTDGPNTGP